MPLPIVAIIGRPNVGKSTLFNCFAGSKKAIVSDIAGTTRDSLMERVAGENFTYLLVDTAGLTDVKGDSLEEEIQLQAQVSVENADMIVFVLDGRQELTRDDEDIAAKLRKGKKPVVFVANKIDDGNEDRIMELTKFGFGMPVAVSATNHTGLWELEEQIEKALGEAGFTPHSDESDEEEASTINLAFVGRPNVGKSSLLNHLVGHKRSVVSDVAGTTRDTIDIEYEDKDGQVFRLLDTAGLRRPGKIGKGIEFWSSVRTRSAIEDADICILMIDALDGVTHQDLSIAGKILEAGKGVIIGVNKFDLVREKARAEEEEDERELDEVEMWAEGVEQARKNYLRYLSQRISFLPWAPVLFFSAKTGRGVDDIFQSAKGIWTERNRRVSTADLNRFVPEVYYGHVQPTAGTKRGKIKYASQVDVSPPKFLFHVNNKAAFHFSYRRYLENKLREKYGFFGTPIVIELRDSMGERNSK